MLIFSGKRMIGWTNLVQPEFRLFLTLNCDLCKARTISYFICKTITNIRFQNNLLILNLNKDFLLATVFLIKSKLGQFRIQKKMRNPIEAIFYYYVIKLSYSNAESKFLFYLELIHYRTLGSRNRINGWVIMKFSCNYMKFFCFWTFES